LQFSFPGFRHKEEQADPMLWAIRRFLGNRVSAIVMLGFSGQWDAYLLRFLFDLARERDLVVADVKPGGDETDALIDGYRASYYPSIPAGPPTADEKVGAVFMRIRLGHETFIPELKAAGWGQIP